jgi:hypothetical protein
MRSRLTARQVSPLAPAGVVWLCLLSTFDWSLIDDGR